MATTPVTTDVSTTVVAPPITNATPTTGSSETSSATATSQTTTASTTMPESGGSVSEGELNPHDFDSLEDFAQALIDRKQSVHHGGSATISPPGRVFDTQPTTAGLRQSETASAAADSPARLPDTENDLSSENNGQDRNDNEVTEAQTQEDKDSQPGAAALQTLNSESQSFLSPEALTQKINASPALKQALEADPPLRDAILRNAELASEAAGYRDVFPDVESARHAAGQFTELAALDHAFLNATTKDAAQDFFSRWARLAMVTDENGNVVRDQNGNPQMHGAWSNVNQHLFDSQLDYVRNRAESAGDHELVAALDVVRESFFDPRFAGHAGTFAQPPVRHAAEQLPPHLQAAADSINRREQELARQQLAQQERNIVAFEGEVSRQASAQLGALVRPIVEKAALPDFVRQTAQQKIESAILSGLKKDRFFQSRLSELERLPRNDETLRQRLNLIATHAQAMAGPIARQVLREASQPVIKAQEDRKAKIESQIARTRSEPKSIGGAVAPGSVRQTPEQVLAHAREQLHDELGEEPNMSQVIERFAKLRKTSF